MPNPTFLLASVLFLVTLLTACEGTTLTGQDADLIDESGAEFALSAKNTSPPGLATGTADVVASFDPFAGELPEGIAIDRFGSIYVSLTGLGEIWKLSKDGAFEAVVATFPLNPGDSGVLGLRFGARGDLYAVVASSNAAANGVWRISGDGSMERLDGTGSLVFPNDVEVLPNGTVYITDSAAGAVWRFRPGGPAEIWIQDELLEGTGAFGVGVPIGANGALFVHGMKSAPEAGPSKGALLVSNSEKAQLVLIPIEPDGSAGSPVVLIADPLLFGLDGITADARGTIYGAVNVANTLVRIVADGEGPAVVVSGPPLDFPASLAFGAGPTAHSLFLTNFALIHLLSDPPAPENAAPGVVRVDVGAPGVARQQ